jgi:hypothetical protein
VGLDAADVVATERSLDRVEVRQRLAAAAGALGDGAVDVRRIGLRRVAGGHHARRREQLHERLLAGGACRRRCGGADVGRSIAAPAKIHAPLLQIDISMLARRAEASKRERMHIG